jgi:hypothetical protein
VIHQQGLELKVVDDAAHATDDPGMRIGSMQRRRLVQHVENRRDPLIGRSCGARVTGAAFA